MKLKDMTDRELLLFNIGETRRNTKLLNNHLAHHEKQDDRRYRLHAGLIIAFVAMAGSLFIAMVT